MKSDVARYRKLTRNKSVVMGGQTYREYRGGAQEAFGSEAKIIVLTRSAQSLPDAEVVSSPYEIVQRAKTEVLWVIGGGNIFAQLLPYADKMYLTRVHGSFEADTFFPEFDPAEWHIREQSSYPAGADNPYPYTFVTYERQRS